MNKKLSFIMIIIFIFNIYPQFAFAAGYQNDFTSNASDFKMVNSNGSWTIVDGWLVGECMDKSSQVGLTASKGWGSPMTVELDLRVDDMPMGGSTSLYILAQGSSFSAKDSYAATFYADKIRLQKRVNGEEDKTFEKPIKNPNGTVRKVRLSYTGKEIMLFVDDMDKPIFTRKDDLIFSDGMIGLGVYKSKCSYDNFKISSSVTAQPVTAATATPKPGSTSAPRPQDEKATKENAAKADVFAAVTPRPADKWITPPTSGGNKAKDRQGLGPKPVFKKPEGLPAFPGAEGFGSTAVGGRGGKIIYVTNLNPSGPGSFRNACEAEGKRIVVFAVSGTIHDPNRLYITNPYLTIAGQTAPGEGITLAGSGMAIQAPEIIVRGLKSRNGDIDYDPSKPGVQPIGDNRNCMVISTSMFSDDFSFSPTNIIIDHCSLTWGVDENITTYYGASNITMSYNIFSESLHDSVHSEGPHSDGPYVGCDSSNVTMHHNLISTCNDRNGRIEDNVSFEAINNVFYDWGYRGSCLIKSGHLAGEAFPSYVNYIGNYFKPGFDSRSNLMRGIQILDNKNAPNPASKFYVKDNIGPGRYVGSLPETATITGDKNLVTSELAWPLSGVTIHPVEEAYTLVLENAGAITPHRDRIDSRIIKDVYNGTGKIIDSQEEVGGFIDPGQYAVPKDTDLDGIPDEWEIGHGLDPNNSGDGNSLAASGYTWVEEYINGLIPIPKSDGRKTYNVLPKDAPASDNGFYTAGGGSEFSLTFKASDFTVKPVEKVTFSITTESYAVGKAAGWEKAKMSLWGGNVNLGERDLYANGDTPYDAISTGGHTFWFDITEYAKGKLENNEDIIITVKGDNTKVRYTAPDKYDYIPLLEVLTQSNSVGTLEKLTSENLTTEKPGENHYKFNDIADVSWAVQAIEALADKNIVNGTGGNMFNPHGTVTRAEYVKMLMGIFNTDEYAGKSSFTDISESEWYYRYAANAESIGIFNGIYSGTFSPNIPISREDMSALAYNMSTAFGVILSKGTPAMEFSDKNEMADYAVKGIEAMQKAGIINGKGDGIFAPKDTATRAEAAKIIYFLYQQK